MSTTAAAAAVATIATQTASGKESLGGLLWWKVTGRHEHAQLLAAFTARGLEKLTPSALDTERAFRRSVRRAVTGVGGTTLVRPVVDDSKNVVLGVVAERADARAQDLDYQVVDRLGFDKAAKTITGSNSVTRAAVEAETRGLERMVEGQDLTSALVRWVGSVGGCALRDNGGVYWVPPSASAQLAQLAAAVEDGTGGACSVYVLPLTSSGEAQRGIGDSAKAGLEAQVVALAKEVEEFKAEAPSVKSLENRLKKFQELRQRASMYRDLLKVSAGDLEAKIGEMEDAVRALVAAAPATAPRASAALKFAPGERVVLKAEHAPTYRLSGVTAADVLTLVDQPSVAKGTVWATTASGLQVIVAKAHVDAAPVAAEREDTTAQGPQGATGVVDAQSSVADHYPRG